MLIGNLQLEQNILPATEFTYVAPCTPDNLINIRPHEKLSPKAGNLETNGAAACDVIKRQSPELYHR